MKKILAIVLCSMTVWGTADAGPQYSQNIKDMILGSQYYCEYTVTNELGNLSENERKNIQMPLPAYKKVTLAKNGADVLMVSGIFQGREFFGNQYALYKNGDSFIFTIGKDNIVRDVIGFNQDAGNGVIVFPEGQITQGVKYSLANLYYTLEYTEFFNRFLPLLPEYNKTPGNESVKFDKCSEFSGSGTEFLDGKNLFYEEYKTPDGYEYPAVSRFYFADGKPVKIVRNIDVAYKLKDRIIPLKYTVDILKLTADFSNQIMQLPEGIKIKKNTDLGKLEFQGSSSSQNQYEREVYDEPRWESKYEESAQDGWY